MAKCLMCPKEFPSNIVFQSNGFSIKDSSNQNPMMLIKRSKAQCYDILCSEKCTIAKILSMNSIKNHINEKWELIFEGSQIQQGIIEQLVNLNNMLKQEIELTQNVYQKQTNSHLIEEFSKRKSQSILSLVDNITAEFIQHLDEAIKFSMSEIEKINSIKQHFENYLKEQGKINLLNQEGHLKLCEEDIKKYRVDEMIQLMENLRKAKLTINHILGEKKD